MAYNFLILSLLFLIPGTIIYAIRKDLRPVIHIMVLCSLPFAMTERFFYPEYWEPVFLFDLVHVIGFGIEDILFVSGLAAFTSTSYAFFTKQGYLSAQQPNRRPALLRCLQILIPAFILTGLMVFIHVSMIYGAVIIMILMSTAIVLSRRDLLSAGIYGGLISMIIYTCLCLILAHLLPGIFQLTWHTDQFLNLFILGIPAEEILYGFASGMIATLFYPFVTGAVFNQLPEAEK